MEIGHILDCLIEGLFNNIFSTTCVIQHWMVGFVIDNWETTWKWMWFILCYPSAISLDAPIKTMKSLSQDCQSQAEDLNPEHFEYEVKELHFTVMLNCCFSTVHSLPNYIIHCFQILKCSFSLLIISRYDHTIGHLNA